MLCKSCRSDQSNCLPSGAGRDPVPPVHGGCKKTKPKMSLSHKLMPFIKSRNQSYQTPESSSKQARGGPPELPPGNFANPGVSDTFGRHGSEKGHTAAGKQPASTASMLEFPISWGTTRPFPILGSARSLPYQPYLKS